MGRSGGAPRGATEVSGYGGSAFDEDAEFFGVQRGAAQHVGGSTSRTSTSAPQPPFMKANPTQKRSATQVATQSPSSNVSSSSPENALREHLKSLHVPTPPDELVLLGAGAREVNGLYSRTPFTEIPVGFRKLCRSENWNAPDMWFKLNGKNDWYRHEKTGGYLYYNQGDECWWIDTEKGISVYKWSVEANLQKLRKEGSGYTPVRPGTPLDLNTTAGSGGFGTTTGGFTGAPHQQEASLLAAAPFAPRLHLVDMITPLGGVHMRHAVQLQGPATDERKLRGEQLQMAFPVDEVPQVGRRDRDSRLWQLNTSGTNMNMRAVSTTNRGVLTVAGSLAHNVMTNEGVQMQLGGDQFAGGQEELPTGNGNGSSTLVEDQNKPAPIKMSPFEGAGTLTAGEIPWLQILKLQEKLVRGGSCVPLEGWEMTDANKRKYRDRDAPIIKVQDSAKNKPCLDRIGLSDGEASPRTLEGEHSRELRSGDVLNVKSRPSTTTCGAFGYKTTNEDLKQPSSRGSILKNRRAATADGSPSSRTTGNRSSVKMQEEQSRETSVGEASLLDALLPAFDSLLDDSAAGSLASGESLPDLARTDSATSSSSLSGSKANCAMGPLFVQGGITAPAAGTLEQQIDHMSLLEAGISSSRGEERLIHDELSVMGRSLQSEASTVLQTQEASLADGERVSSPAELHDLSAQLPEQVDWQQVLSSPRPELPRHGDSRIEFIGPRTESSCILDAVLKEVAAEEAAEARAADDSFLAQPFVEAEQQKSLLIDQNEFSQHLDMMVHFEDDVSGFIQHSRVTNAGREEEDDDLEVSRVVGEAHLDFASPGASLLFGETVVEKLREASQEFPGQHPEYPYPDQEELQHQVDAGEAEENGAVPDGAFDSVLAGGSSWDPDRMSTSRVMAAFAAANSVADL
ncbi:unnamed protein product [Amoebophrya sp. A25]|nr:unnamed protein product [Amoebophrya sp. A25]|eukprot:GSA25T00010593001.1